jgi:hypothetical protein
MPAMPAMPAMPSAPSVPRWSEVTSIGVCSPASAAADVQGEDDSKTAPEEEPGSMAPAHKPSAESQGDMQSDAAAASAMPAASASKFAAASEAAKLAVAAVGDDASQHGKRGRRRGAATRITDPAAVAQPDAKEDAKEENDIKDDSSWRRGCALPSMPSMPALPTREGLAGKLSCAASRKEGEGDAAMGGAPSVMQRLACTGARKAAEPAGTNSEKYSTYLI